VQVQWTDRTNQGQTVTLDSAISASAPTLTALLMVPHRESALARRQGLHQSIPDGAAPVSGSPGLSQYSPPGGGTTVWYFNNTSGVMRVCGAPVADVTTCPLGTLVSGTVRFHTTTEQPTLRDASAPASDALPLAAGPGALVMVDAVGAGTAASCYSSVVGRRVVYHCAVLTNDTTGWGGQLNLVLETGSFPNPPTENSFKSCRYTPDLPSTNNPDTPENEADPNGDFTANADHPRKYCLERPRNSNEAGNACTGRRVRSNLINQDFLVIRGTNACPTYADPNDTDRDPLVFANTRQHQPTP
jgi:hypothetical protein